MTITFYGDLTDHTITDLVYINSARTLEFFKDSYYLFYPAAIPSGTKLYRHEITFGGDTYRFILISTDSVSYVNNVSSNVVGVNGVSHNQYTAKQGIGASIQNFGSIVATIYYVGGSEGAYTVEKIEGIVLTDTVTEL